MGASLGPRKNATRVNIMSDDTNTDENTAGVRISTEKTGWDGTAATKAEESQQIEEERYSTDEVDVIKPPYNPHQLAQLTLVNETNYTCVSKKARYTAGYGLDLVPHSEADQDEPPGLDTVREFWFGSDSTFQMGPRRREVTPSEVLERAWYDYEGIGWYALEVMVSTDGTPVGLAHVPAQTIRIREDDAGYVQVKPGTTDRRYFASAGMRYGDDKQFVDSETGDVGDSVADVGDVANELIVQHNPSVNSLFYGVPDSIPAMTTIEGDEGAKNFNVDFFENNATPRLALLVEGGTVGDKVRKQIRKTFREQAKGSENAHRTVIVDVEPSHDPVEAEFGNGGESSVNISLEPLTVGVEEDASFTDYRSWNEHEILKVHDVPPVVAGRVESGAFSTDSAEQRRYFAEEVIAPKQESFAAQLYHSLHQTALDVDGWTPEFAQRGAENRQREAEVAKTKIQAVQGALTANEARAEVGLGPITGPNGEELPIGNMLLTEVTGGGAGVGGTPGLIDDDALDQLLEAHEQEIVDQLREQYGYQVTDRPNLED